MLAAPSSVRCAFFAVLAVIVAAVSVRLARPQWWIIPWVTGIFFGGATLVIYCAQRKPWSLCLTGALLIGGALGLAVYYVPAIDRLIGH